MTIPVDLGLWNDVNPEDNEVTQSGVDIEVGPIGASISQSNSNGIYTTDETMTLVARTSDTAAAPQLHVEDRRPFDLVPAQVMGRSSRSRSTLWTSVITGSNSSCATCLDLRNRGSLTSPSSTTPPLTVDWRTPDKVSLDEAVLAHEVSLRNLASITVLGTVKHP